ncbi:MAG TPA: protein kinase, partial [Bryobacteraceae bacterium]
MTAERWRKVREVFDKAVECAPSEAERVVRQACGADSDLSDEVRRLLAEHERSSPLDRPVWDPPAGNVFAAGQTVAGRYRIERYLSHGGMGEVYEAHDLELGERVALKTLLQEIAGDERMIARFKLEIQLSRKIGHQNVCRVFDLARHPADASAQDPVYFLTMEFLDGETLADLLEREGRMSTAAAQPLLDQMAQALDAAHRAGVVHRDFKPSNVMLIVAGAGLAGAHAHRAVVTDFGLARSYSPNTETLASKSSPLMGTLDYMAPELLTGSKATFATDIYALGMVAYKMITGELPFASDTPFGAAILRSKQPPPSPRKFVADLDPRWERAILRALDPNPARRFSSAAEFIRGLRGDSSAITVPFPAMTWRKWTAVAAAAALAAGALLGWAAWMRARNQPSAEALAYYQGGVDQIHNGAYFAATKALGQAVTLAPSFCLAHARLAEAWLSLEAQEKANREMVLALSGNTSALSKADRLQLSAVGHLTTREYPAAATDYEHLVEAGPSGNQDVYLDLGTTYLLAGKRDLAVQTYRKATEGRTPRPAAWMWLGMAYARGARDPADISKSEEAFEKAAEGYRFKSNLEGMTSLAYHRALASVRLGDLELSNKYLRQTVETARLAQNAYFEIAAETQMSMNACTAGDAESGERLAREALETAQANQMEMLSINSFLGLATARVRRGDFQGAEKYYRDALALAQRNNSLRWVAQAQLWLAALHDQMRLPDQASREAGEALTYFRPQHWEQETLRALVLIGRAESTRGHYAAAKESFNQLLAAADANHDQRSRYLAEEGLGSAFSTEENYPQALDHYQKMRKASPSPEQAGYAALRCGRTLAVLGDYSGASRMFEEVDPAAEKFPALRLYLALARAEVSLSAERFSEAANHARLGFAPDQHPNAVTRANLKWALGLALLRSAGKTQGKRECEEALSSLENAGDPAALVAARLAAMEARLETGQTAGALVLLGQLEPTLSSYPESAWRAMAIFSRFVPLYRDQARQALRELEQRWPPDLYRGYMQRPDIKKLARPFLQ